MSKATKEMMKGNSLFDGLPVELQDKIIDYNKRGRGRPASSKEMKVAAKDKKNIRERGRGRLAASTKSGNIDTFLNTLDVMKDNSILGEKAANTELTKFIKQNKDIFKARQDRIFEDKADDITSQVLRESMKDVKIEEGAPVKLQIVDKFSDRIESNDRGKTKMTDAARLRAATKKMMANEREAALRKRSQLSDHFSNFDKSEPVVKVDVDVDNTKVQQKGQFAPTLVMPKIIESDLRQILTEQNVDFRKEDLMFLWENLLDEDMKDNLGSRNYNEIEKIKNLIIAAQQTRDDVPDYVEENGDMTIEERQVEFHKSLIEKRVSVNLKKELANKQAPQTNFDNNEKACGGINQGKNINMKTQENINEQPEIWEDYSHLLDSKITDDAYNRELYKGINVNTVSVMGKTDEENDDFFIELNAINNIQDNNEINDALQTIEILSGGVRDSLFGANDLLSTRRNNPASRGNFQQDIPDDIDNNPAPITRGRNAQPLDEIDEDEIKRKERVEGVTTIASTIGILGNAYRGIFGKNDIAASRQTDILSDMNQNMRLIGKRGLFGEDMGLKEDNDIYEGVTSFATRMNDMENYAHYRDYNSMGGVRNPSMLQHKEEKEAVADQQLTQALMFNKGAATQGSSLPQLRETAFAYKQANRKVAHDGYSFIRGGKSTAIQLDSEFDP